MIFVKVEGKVPRHVQSGFGTVRFIILILAGHEEMALENAALRQQLAIFKGEQPRPKLRHRDSLFWIALAEGLEKMESGTPVTSREHEKLGTKLHSGLHDEAPLKVAAYLTPAADHQPISPCSLLA